MRMVEGYIDKIDPKKMQARVKLEAHCDSDGNPMITDWLQIGFTGPDIQYIYRVGDYVGCIMDDTLDDGWIICRLYPDDASLDSTETKTFFKFKNGSATVEVDETKEKVTVKVGSLAEIKITQQGVEISGTGPDGAVNGVVHAMSPCPVFGTCHLQFSNTVKVSQ